MQDHHRHGILDLHAPAIGPQLQKPRGLWAISLAWACAKRTRP